MAKETQIGQLVIDLKIKTEALEKGLEVAKKKLESIEQENKKVENSNKSLESSWIAVAATATIALTGIISSIKSATEEYKSHTQAMSSLQNVSDYTGKSMSDLSSIMEKYEGIMTKSDLATTIKNFTLMGMEAEETEKMIEALTNSAIRNRNANYTVSEAVRVASEGYRQGLSTLSDSAGVTENLSVMLDNYAQSIGKTASQLTEAEKNQAYLNRTMYAAEPFAGAMADYMDTLAGKQGQYSQEIRETQVAYTEALEPLLLKFEEFKTKMVSGLGDIISVNKSATAGTTTFIITLGTLVLGITAVIKIIQSYKTAIDTLNMSAKTLKITMGGAFAASVIVGSITSIITAVNTLKQEQQELAEAQQFYNSVLEKTIELNRENVNSMQSNLEDMHDYIEKLKEYMISLSGEKVLSRSIGTAESEEEAKKFREELQKLQEKNKALRKSLEETSDEFKKLYEIEKEGLLTTDDLSEYIKTYTDRLDEATSIEKIKKAMDTEALKTQQKEAAQLKLNANQMQSYLNIVKKGKTSSAEYQQAVKALTKAYPEAANAQGIIIDKAQDYINTEKAKADQSWNTVQEIINGDTEVINKYIQMAQEAEGNIAKQQKLANSIGISYNNIIPTLTSVLNIITAIGKQKPEEVEGTGEYYNPKVTKSTGSKSYSNKALDNYKKEIEYKKSLDKLSLEEEIKMYETALKKYAKTTDEKRELITKIYELNKELNEAELNNYTGKIEYKKSLDKISLEEEIKMYETALKKYATTAEEKKELRIKIYELNKEMAYKEKEILNQQTEDYEAYIQKQRNAKGASYDVKEQQKDYDKIIKIHQKYLKQIMKDERLSLEERKQIYKEELQIIRDYEQQKRDLRVEQIDNTVTQLTNAIKKQLEEMQEKDKEMIDANIEEVEKWKEIRINAINEEYDARIEAINKELEALDKAEQQKTRNEEDTEYERKKQRLQELVDFEHDATTKANYQKELNKLIAEYQETLNDRALEDKKEALNTQKDLLQQEQDEKVQAVENETEKQKEIYEKQLDSIEEYYENQINSAQETAEKMLLNVEDNQKTILNLLKNYGDDYEITGQTLGEKLAQGINNGLTGKIENVIKKIQESIDKGIESKIGEMTSGTYKYTAGSNKPTVTNVTNVTQQNYIQQMQEMPSETYRKLNDVSQKLAAELSV